jgi:hypothetical protein
MFFSLAVLVLITILSLTIMAQNPTLQDINSDKVVLQNYMTISSLPVDQKSGIFANISNEDKANLFRFHLAFQILKRPWLNQLQKDFLLETISTVSPQSYDQSPQIVALNQQNAQLLQQKILGLFQKQEGFDIFANLGGDSKDIEVLQKYNETNLPFYTVNRRQVFSRLSPIEKSNTMKIHLLRHMSRFDLTLEQRRFILTAVSLATLELYATRQETIEGANIMTMIKSFSSQIPNFFNPKDGVAIFLTLGGAEGKGQKNITAVKLINESATTTNFVQPAYFNSILPNINSMRFMKINLMKYENLTYETADDGGCGCAKNDDLCDWQTPKTHCGSADCTSSTWGCGVIWWSPCNGTCQRDLID